MIRPNPVLQTHIAEKLPGNLIVAAHRHPIPSSGDHLLSNRQRLFQQPASAPTQRDGIGNRLSQCSRTSKSALYLPKELAAICLPRAGWREHVSRLPGGAAGRRVVVCASRHGSQSPLPFRSVPPFFRCAVIRVAQKVSLPSLVSIPAAAARRRTVAQRRLQRQRPSCIDPSNIYTSSQLLGPK